VEDYQNCSVLYCVPCVVLKKASLFVVSVYYLVVSNSALVSLERFISKKTFIMLVER